MKRKNAASVWIMARRIGQSGESDLVAGFLSASGRCEIVPVNSFAAAAVGVAVAVFEGTASNSSSWGGSCYYYNHLPHRHAGNVHVGRSPALGP